MLLLQKYVNSYDITKEQSMQELNTNEIDAVAGGLLPESSVGGDTNW
ncbi:MULTISPECIES: hypothetical protein [unclassified Janthinobacterium]|nr:MULTISPECIES: hypothetical protein [unclassified Janthinobacterium]SDA43563.1 hypothetical protein SAMN03159349_00760 [Janthinobacterium sp. 551a]SFA91912.1 hypothetical protein SAMN03159300_101761 [Janthinobacterium sp. 344]